MKRKKPVIDRVFLYLSTFDYAKDKAWNNFLKTYF